jgi:hypothetical protein
MSSDSLGPVERGLRGALVGAIGAFLLAYLGVVAARMAYPFELEWMEGGMLAHVQRLLDGKPIYAPPSMEFVSFLYPPLYYYAGALATTIGGVNLVSLRAVSFAGSLVSLWLLFAIARHETRSRLAGVLAAGLFVASYERSGAWLDLARADSFYIMWLLASVALLRLRPSAGGTLAAGLALACAFFVKQSVLVVAAPMALALWYVDRRRALLFTSTATAAVVLGVVALELSHDGWFLYYTFTVPRAHPVAPEQIWSYWTIDVAPLGVAGFAAFSWVIAELRTRSDPDRFFFPLLLAGLALSSWSVRSLVGAHLNNLLPVYIGFALGGALALHTALRVATRSRERIGVFVLAIVQLILLSYDPRTLVPTRADEAAGRELVARIAAIEGEVYIPNHGYLAELAGKRAYAHTLAMDNLLLDDFGPARQALERDFEAHLRDGRFAAMIVESDRRYERFARAFFGEGTPLFENDSVFRAVSGGAIRPETIYRRR